MSDELQYEVVNSMLLDVAHVCGYAMNVNQIQHVSQRSYGVGSFNGYSLVSKLPYVEYLCILHLLDSMLVFIKKHLEFEYVLNRTVQSLGLPVSYFGLFYLLSSVFLNILFASS